MTLQEQLNAINEAIASGARKVKYNDKEIEYRTLDEMIQIRDSLREQLGLTETRRANPTYSKGL